MNLDDYRAVFSGVVLVSLLVSVSPIFSFYLPSRGERFSELWVLGPNHMAEDYPFNVVVGRSYGLFVGVGCHLGGSSYYRVYVKFRNQTQPLPNVSLSTPSPMPPLYEFQVFLRDSMNWEAPVNFTIMDASFGNNSTFLGHLAINEMVFEVNCTATWDTEYKGCYYQLFFELWLYDLNADSFQYHNRFVGIWLNMTC